MSRHADQVAEAFGVIGRSVQDGYENFSAHVVEAMSRVSQSESTPDTH